MATRQYRLPWVLSASSSVNDTPVNQARKPTITTEIDTWTWFLNLALLHSFVPSAGKIHCFTCRGPWLDVACAVNHDILGLALLGWTQTIPEVKEELYNIVQNALIRCFVLKSCCYKASPSSLSPQHNNLNRRFKNNAKPVVTYFCSSGSSVCSWTMVPLDKSQTCTEATTQTCQVSLDVLSMTNWRINYHRRHTSFCR